uniref:SGNH hydrolase-type esterase domain-containing protein n=1 Tax=Sinocyclocheilus rhinocerous TaxID=307959 RepID=A0A673JT96_9TELE
MLAGEDTLQLELEAVEKQICDLVERQTQLRERRAALESSQADAHKSEVSIQRAANSPTTSTPCVSLHRPGSPRTRSSQMSFTLAPGHHGPWVPPQRKTRARPRETTSHPPPPPVFEISTWKHFAPLRETECDAVIIGDSLAGHFFGGAQGESGGALPPLRDFRSLIETVRSTSPEPMIIVSGPLPTYQRGHKRFSRLFALNEWLLSWCKEQKQLFVNNWNLFWERPRLFRADGLHPSRVGAELMSDNISRTLRTI